MRKSQYLSAADFEAAARAAAGRTSAELYAESGLAPGPARWMLAVGEVHLPLRLFAALALRHKGLAEPRPTTAEARELAQAAGLTAYDGHRAEGPLRTG